MTVGVEYWKEHSHVLHIVEVEFKISISSNYTQEYNLILTTTKMRWCMFVCLYMIQSRKNYGTDFKKILQKNALNTWE